MKPEQIERLQKTFDCAVADGSAFGRRFYSKLFEKQPDYAKLFRGDMDHQADLLVSMLEAIVDCLSSRAQVVPMIYELGRHHASLGVRPHHYGPFAEVLIATLQEAVGPSFEAEDEQAWREALQFMGEVMQGPDAPASAPSAKSSQQTLS